MSKNVIATIGNAGHILTLAGQKGLTEEAFDDLNSGFLADLFEAAVAGNLKKTDREKLRVILGLPPLTPPALELFREIDCPATEAFDLYDFFNIDNPTVKFRWVDADLRKYFKIRLIEAEGPRQLAISKLTRTVTEKELLAVAPKKTTWADLKWRLEQQPHGEGGDLLVNGWTNLFLIGDCLVRVYRNGDGWGVSVNPVDETFEWLGGGRLTSRN